MHLTHSPIATRNTQETLEVTDAIPYFRINQVISFASGTPESLVLQLAFPRRPVLLRCPAREQFLAAMARMSAATAAVDVVEGSISALRSYWGVLQGTAGMRHPTAASGVGLPLPFPLDRQLRAAVRGPQEER